MSQVLTDQSNGVRAFVSLVRAHVAVTRRLSAQLMADHGLTINDYEVLLRLTRAPDQQLRRVDLAEEVLLTPSGITRLLDGLERAGYVARATCESDRRVVYAVLTEEGRGKLRDASTSHVAQIEELFEDYFDTKELASMGDLLERLGDGKTGDCGAESLASYEKPACARRPRLLDVDPFDACVRRAVAKPRHEHLDVLLGSLDLGLDRAVGTIPHPPGHAELLGSSARALPEPDALHAAVHDDPATDELHRPSIEQGRVCPCAESSTTSQTPASALRSTSTPREGERRCFASASARTSSHGPMPRSSSSARRPATAARVSPASRSRRSAS